MRRLTLRREQLAELDRADLELVNVAALAATPGCTPFHCASGQVRCPVTALLPCFSVDVCD